MFIGRSFIIATQMTVDDPDAEGIIFKAVACEPPVEGAPLSGGVGS